LNNSNSRIAPFSRGSKAVAARHNAKQPLLDSRGSETTVAAQQQPRLVTTQSNRSLTVAAQKQQSRLRNSSGFHACPVEHLSDRRKHSLINQSQSFRPVVDFNAGGAIADHPTAPATAAEN
jgi:hypothetical protein